MNEEFYKDEKLNDFIKLQEKIFEEENKNELSGIKQEGYKNFEHELFVVKAKENVINNHELSKYVNISSNGLIYYFNIYDNKLNVTINERNLNSNENIILCGSFENDTLYINNFYGPNGKIDEYTKKFKSLVKKLEEISKFYEKEFNFKIKKSKISIYL